MSLRKAFGILIRSLIDQVLSFSHIRVRVHDPALLYKKRHEHEVPNLRAETMSTRKEDIHHTWRSRKLNVHMA